MRNKRCGTSCNLSVAPSSPTSYLSMSSSMEIMNWPTWAWVTLAGETSWKKAGDSLAAAISSCERLSAWVITMSIAGVNTFHQHDSWYWFSPDPTRKTIYILLIKIVLMIALICFGHQYLLFYNMEDPAVCFQHLIPAKTSPPHITAQEDFGPGLWDSCSKRVGLKCDSNRG